MLHHQDNWEWQVPDGRVACFDYTQLRQQAASEARWIRLEKAG
jgi:hypothetical protein